MMNITSDMAVSTLTTGMTSGPTMSQPSSSTSVQPTDHDDVDKHDESLKFILVPLCAIGVVVMLTAMVLLFLRKKRLDRLRHHLMPFYNFDPGEEGEDWEAELLEENGDMNNARKGYKSMEYSPTHQKTHLSID